LSPGQKINLQDSGFLHVWRGGSGEWSRNGVADELKWCSIQSKAAAHPNWSYAQLASALSCSKYLVQKVLQRAAIGEMVPQQHGTGEKQKMEAHHIALSGGKREK